MALVVAIVPPKAHSPGSGSQTGLPAAPGVMQLCASGVKCAAAFQ